MAVAAIKPPQRPTPVKQAMASADATLLFDKESQLEVVNNKYSNVFFSGPEDIGRTKLIYHKIDIGENKPVRQGLCRIPHEQISFCKAEVDKLHKMKAIEFSISTLASLTVLVKKKDGTMRLCIDYRRLNSITKNMLINFLGLMIYSIHLVDQNISLHWIWRWGTIK